MQNTIIRFPKEIYFVKQIIKWNKLIVLHFKIISFLLFPLPWRWKLRAQLATNGSIFIWLTGCPVIFWDLTFCYKYSKWWHKITCTEDYQNERKEYGKIFKWTLYTLDMLTCLNLFNAPSIFLTRHRSG